MRVRTFVAASMPEAMALVRAEMGEDAVILSSQRSKHGLEVKAAAERKPVQAAGLEDVDTAYSRLASLEAEFERRLLAAVAEPRPSTNTARTTPWTLEAMVQRLAFHEMPRALIERLCATAAKFSPDNGLGALAHAIEAQFTFDPLPPELDRPIALIGSPGAGKTACAAKLAVRAVLAGRTAVLISSDDSAGAASQVAAFGDIIRARVISVENAEGVSAAIDKVLGESERPAIIIDTAGVNPFDRAETAYIRDIVTAADAEPIVVMPSAGGRDLEDHAIIFKALGARRLIATRMDLTRRLGGLLSAVASAGLVFAQGSASPYIAETLEPMNAHALARRLLTDPGAAPASGGIP